MTVFDWLKDAQAKLFNNGNSARLDSLLLLSSVLDKSKEWILTNPDYVISSDELAQVNELVQSRLAHQPIAQLIGYKEFYGYKFNVTKSVLTPRPETEELVDYVVKNAPKGSRVLDMGTGSGCIAASIKLARPDLTITASDISKQALAVAKGNADNLNTDIEFIESDLFSNINSTYDIICANLPYVPTENHATNEEIKHEPAEALFSGADGMDHYNTFLKSAPKYLSGEGFLIIEHDPVQFVHINKISEAKKISDYISLLSSL